MNLKQSIEQLYLTFSKYLPPEKVLDFDCVSCLNKKDEDYLLKTPLRKLNDHIFGGIMESCNTIEMGDKCYKYYIPRILELTTLENYDFSFSFVEYVYRDFAKFNYQSTFNQKEIKAIDDFFYAFLEQEFSRDENERDESEIFNVAETGYNSSHFLEKISKQEEWSKIKSELEYHLELQRKWAKSEQKFKEWTNKGKRNEIIEFINNDKTTTANTVCKQ